jgi:hypothetical protein
MRTKVLIDKQDKTGRIIEKYWVIPDQIGGLSVAYFGRKF